MHSLCRPLINHSVFEEKIKKTFYGHRWEMRKRYRTLFTTRTSKDFMEPFTGYTTQRGSLTLVKLHIKRKPKCPCYTYITLMGRITLALKRAFFPFYTFLSFYYKILIVFKWTVIWFTVKVLATKSEKIMFAPAVRYTKKNPFYRRCTFLSFFLFSLRQWM